MKTTTPNTSNRTVRRLAIIAPAVITLALAACDSKSCKCYVYNGTNTPYMEYEYVNEGTSCSTLDYNRGTQYRTCVEYNEPDINPGDIAQEYKKN